jgi:hypothetical protein
MEQTLIEAGDTTTFSEKTTVYVLSQEQQQIRYYEPLGDGFYFAPVTISIIDNGIRVSGERNHLWQFRIKLPAEPASVSGADEWAYDATRQYLNVEKEGMQFEFSYAAP